MLRANVRTRTSPCVAAQTNVCCTTAVPQASTLGGKRCATGLEADNSLAEFTYSLTAIRLD